MILVDTSVWIDHFRHGSRELEALLNDGLVLTHPFIIGELASGTLPSRRQTLTDLAKLPSVNVTLHEDVMHFVEKRALCGRGISWIDCHLLASALLASSNIWTFDLRLKRAAESVGLS